MNNLMKRSILMFSGVVCIVTILFSGCIQQNEPQGIKIVTSFYPLAFFAKEIGGDYVSVTQLIPDNTELHNWQPTVLDIVATNQADILIYNGAQLDTWFKDDILSSINQTGKIIIETTKDIQLIPHSTNDYLGEFNAHDTDRYDPHTWISPYIAQIQAEHIYTAISEKDYAHQEYYTQRWNELNQRFITIDTLFKNELSTKQKDAIFVTHMAFGYLAERYGFKQYGVVGLSADEQPSASTIASIIDLMIEHEIYVIYIDPIYSDDYAQTLKYTLESKTEKNIQILTLYLASGIIDGMDYFEQLEKNLENLKIGLQAS